MDKSIAIVGGPIAQPVDPVLQLVPSGHGHLAASIADAFEQHFSHVERIGNFPGGKAVILRNWNKPFPASLQML